MLSGAAFNALSKTLARREWGDAPRTATPDESSIYTMRLPSGLKMRLAAIHILTKELRDWVWVSLFWSDTPNRDFGEDRPASLGGAFANYKMCVVTDFAEGDPDPTGGFATGPGSLGDALDSFLDQVAQGGLLDALKEVGREMAGLSRDYVDPDGFSEVAARLRRLGWRSTPVEETAVAHLEMPRDFRAITGGVATGRHFDYLRSRGFDDVGGLCYDYKLQACTHGQWAHRVIIPYFLDGQLVTWTARAIARSEYRYLDLKVDDSLVPPKETLYNYDCVQEGGEWLIVVEGPIDALKIDFYGKRYGVRAVALSTNSVTEEQVHLLADGFKSFRHLAAMMDRASPTDAIASMRMAQQLRFIDYDAKSLPVPGGAKDAGDADPWDISRFAQELTS